MDLLKIRDESMFKEKTRCAVYFNTFLMPMLEKNYRFGKVSNWRKSVGLPRMFDRKVAFIPVHRGVVEGGLLNHFALLVVWMSRSTAEVTLGIERPERQIWYCDSLGLDGSAYTAALKQYLTDEHREVHKVTLDWQQWTIENQHVVPGQEDVDCGVFTLMFMDYFSQLKPVNFSCKDMLAFRHRILISLIAGGCKKMLTNAGEAPTKA